jgi:hypothetical protein
MATRTEEHIMSSIQMRVSDILAAPNLPMDPWGASSILNRLAQEIQVFGCLNVPDLADLAPYRVEFKGDRNYDGNRGAELHVIYYEDQVICICSFAGRGLDDVNSVYIYNQTLLRDLIMRFVPDEDRGHNDVFDPNELIDVVFWEGCPIQLGKSLYGYDD